MRYLFDFKQYFSAIAAPPKRSPPNAAHAL
jgi:hypothetical protein